MRILILDFNDDFFPIYTRKLEQIDSIEILFAKDINAALSFLKEDPDCILLNHLFFKKFDYYNQLREAGFQGDIIITTPGKTNIIKRSQYNGISGIIDKSLNGEDFRKSFYKILKHKYIEDKAA